MGQTWPKHEEASRDGIRYPYMEDGLVRLDGDGRRKQSRVRAAPTGKKANGT